MKNELVVADCDFEYKDKYYTLDHRRLVAYRLAAREQSIVRKWSGMMRTTHMVGSESAKQFGQCSTVLCVVVVGHI